MHHSKTLLNLILRPAMLMERAFPLPMNISGVIDCVGPITKLDD